MNGMAYDELNGNDSLNLEEISYGISAAGVNFDMLSFDSSLMGSLEIAAGGGDVYVCRLYDCTAGRYRK